MIATSLTAKLRHRWHLLIMLWQRDFQAGYVQNRLGFLWVLLNPLFLVVLYSYVFSTVMSVRTQAQDAQHSYAVFLLSGMVAYLALQEAVMSALGCLQEKKSLLIKSIFPADILPVNSVLLSVVGELATIAVLLAWVAYESGSLLPSWLGIPLLLAVRVVFALGMAWWVSILGVFVPDLRQVLAALFPAWMFITPILYPARMLPMDLQPLQFYNPLYYLVEAYRDVILRGELPAVSIGWVLLGALLLNALGWWLFRKLLPRAKDLL